MNADRGAQMGDADKTDVLLVDFSDSIRSTIADILRVFGFSVQEADDGEIAYELLSERSFGMVLLELDLPKRNGVELLESLDSLPPVVLVSARPIELDEWERVAHKVAGRLRKPTRPEVLVECVRTVLQGGRLVLD